jgi:AcrR family transcriptional regulator
MSKAKKRVYDSEGRQKRAAATRQTVLDAAKQLFQKDGFEGVTIEKIALAAKVSIPTVYALFQSKRGILRALMDEVMPMDQFESLVTATKQEKVPQERLKISAKIVRQMYDAERAQMGLFRGAGLLSPEFKELEQEREERRYRRQEETIKTMVKEKALAKGLGIKEARDMLWAFTGRDLYRLFVIEREWTSDAYEAWLAQLLIKTLIAQ